MSELATQAEQHDTGAELQQQQRLQPVREDGHTYAQIINYGQAHFGDYHDNSTHHHYHSGPSSRQSDNSKHRDTVNSQRIFMVAHAPSTRFTGRKDELELLYKTTLANGKQETKEQRRHVLYGMGGSGKTQIATKFAHQYQQSFWAVLWVDATTSHSLEQSFRMIASELKIENSRETIKHYLSSVEREWLLVFDNADDHNVSLLPYIPTGNQGIILITSRDPNACTYCAGTPQSSQRIGELPLEDAEGLLRRIVYAEQTAANGKDHATDTKDEYLSLVVQAVSPLALAITQAGAYIFTRKCTFEEYLQLYQKMKKSMWQIKPSVAFTDYEYTVATTWKVSLDWIEQAQTPSSKLAIILYRLTAFYNYRLIPRLIFYDVALQDRTDTLGLAQAAGLKTFSSVEECKFHMLDAWHLLASFSLLNLDSSYSLSLHPLTHEWLRECMDADLKAQYRYHALLFLNLAVSYDGNEYDHTFWRAMGSHIRAFVNLTKPAMPVMMLHDWRPWKTLAATFIFNGRNNYSLEILMPLIETMFKFPGLDDDETLDTMSLACVAYRALGIISENIDLAQIVLDRTMKKYGETHSRVVQALNTLAMAYKGAKNYMQSIEILQRAIEMAIELREGVQVILELQHNLVYAYSAVGAHRKALSMTQTLLRISCELSGEQHPDTLAAREGLANAYWNLGQREEGLREQEQLVEVLRCLYGRDHPNSLRCQQTLAVCYMYFSRDAEAITLLEHVVDSQRRKDGFTQTSTIDACKLLLKVYIKDEARLDQAIALAEKVVCRRRLAPIHGQRDAEDFTKFLSCIRCLEDGSDPQMVDQEKTQFLDAFFDVAPKQISDFTNETLGAQQLEKSLQIWSAGIINQNAVLSENAEQHSEGEETSTHVLHDSDSSLVKKVEPTIDRADICAQVAPNGNVVQDDFSIRAQGDDEKCTDIKAVTNQKEERCIQRTNHLSNTDGRKAYVKGNLKEGSSRLRRLISRIK